MPPRPFPYRPHQHHFVKLRNLTAYRCQCGVYYGKSNSGWITKDYRLQLIGQPTKTIIQRGRAIWAEICGLFGSLK